MGELQAANTGCLHRDLRSHYFFARSVFADPTFLSRPDIQINSNLIIAIKNDEITNVGDGGDSMEIATRRMV